MHDYVKTTTGLTDPQTGLQGKFSIYHVLAVALADGAALLDQFTDERLADPALATLRERVHVHTDAEQDKDSATGRVDAAATVARSSATSPTISALPTTR